MSYEHNAIVGYSSVPTKVQVGITTGKNTNIDSNI